MNDDLAERIAQAISWLKGGDHAESGERFDRPAFEAWFRHAADTDECMRSVTPTPALIETCWEEYHLGAVLAPGDPTDAAIRELHWREFRGLIEEVEPGE